MVRYAETPGSCLNAKSVRWSARVLQKAELSCEADSKRTTSGGSFRDYVLHRAGCSQEDDQLLREGRGWPCVHGEGKVGDR